MPFRSFTGLLVVYSGNILLLIYELKTLMKYDKQILIVLLFICSFIGIQRAEKYIYTDIVRSDEDIYVITEIAHTVNRLENKPVAIIGNYENNYTAIMDTQIGTASWSVFYWGEDQISRTYHISEALKSRGIKDDLFIASAEQFTEANSIESTLNPYPNGIWHKDMGDYIIIKIGYIEQ